MKDFFRRFIEIFKPKFLAQNFAELESKKTWQFWFLCNTLFSLIVCLFIFSAVHISLNKAQEYLKQNYPDAKISIIEGKLTTSGIEDPLYKKASDGTVFVIDTKGEKYDESVLSDVKTGVFVSNTKILSKKNAIEKREFDISQINQNQKENVSISTNDLFAIRFKIELIIDIVSFIAIWIYFNAIRLLFAFWWALVFWLVGMVMNVKENTFMKTYFAVLNFYIIPLVITTILGLLNVNIPFATFIIFAILFFANFKDIKRLQKETEDNKATDSI